MEGIEMDYFWILTLQRSQGSSWSTHTRQGIATVEDSGATMDDLFERIIRNLGEQEPIFTQGANTVTFFYAHPNKLS